MFKENKKLIIFLAVSVLTAAELAAFYVFEINTGDSVANKLLKSIIPRIFIAFFALAFILLSGLKSIIKPDFRRLAKNLLWCIPCLLVVIANFPFTAIADGTAKILRGDLIWLYLLYSLSVGLTEEALFRGLVQETVKSRVEGRRGEKLITVLITSAIFGLFHLFNLFSGADVGATLLQVGYSFLIGAMLSAVMLRTDDLWLCVILHSAFNFGGNIVVELGQGEFQDAWFWAFTAIAGVICFVHVGYYLIKDILPLSADGKKN